MANVSIQNYNSGGMDSLVYVPENVNADTEVFVFVHGGGTNNEDRYNDWNSVINYQLNKNGSDSIVVMPTMGNRWDENWASNTMDIVQNIRNDYGVTNSNVTSCGFSFGGWGAARTTIENIQRNPDLEPQVLFMLDDYGYSTQNVEQHILGNGGKEALLQNDSIIISYVSRAAANATRMESDKAGQLEDLANSGVNLMRVVCDNGEHSSIKNNFFLNDMADYTTGGVKLPSEGYTYQRARVSVDPNTGENVISWETVAAEDINTKDKLYSYFGVNGNRGTINSGTLNNGVVGVDGNSSGKVLVDLTTLQEWNTRMNAINEDMMNLLTNLLSTIESLNNSWQGNVSKGFIEDSSSLIETVQRCHNNMNNLSNGLIDVINVESDL